MVVVSCLKCALCMSNVRFFLLVVFPGFCGLLVEDSFVARRDDLVYVGHAAVA